MADEQQPAANPSAPVYEPEKWNSRVGPEDYTMALQAQRDSFLKIHANRTSGGTEGLTEKNRESLERSINFDPTQQARNGINDFMKTVEAKGGDSYAIGQKYGMTTEEVEAFRPMAEGLYFGEKMQPWSNCYRYAMDDRDRVSLEGALPGEHLNDRGDRSLTKQMLDAQDKGDYAAYKEALLKQVEADGAQVAGPDAKDKPGHYRVAVYAKDNAKDIEAGRDVPRFGQHYARQNRDGTFSHQPNPDSPVTNLDDEGNPIKDPRKAKMGHDFLTYVHVPEGGLDVGPVYAPRTKPGSVEIPPDVLEKNDYKRRELPAYPNGGL